SRSSLLRPLSKCSPAARGNYRLQDLQIAARSVIPGLAGTVRCRNRGLLPCGPCFVRFFLLTNRPLQDFPTAASEFPTERIGRGSINSPPCPLGLRSPLTRRNGMLMHSVSSHESFQRQMEREIQTLLSRCMHKFLFKGWLIAFLVLPAATFAQRAA